MQCSVANRLVHKKSLRYMHSQFIINNLEIFFSNQNVEVTHVMLLNGKLNQSFSDTLKMDYFANFSKLPVYTLQQNFAPFLCSVCVSPVFKWEDLNAMEIFIDYYLKHGASKIILYKRQWSWEIDELLEKHKNDVIVVSWPKLPRLQGIDLNDGSVNYYGQNLAINDCLWRMRYR